VQHKRLDVLGQGVSGARITAGFLVLQQLGLLKEKLQLLFVHRQHQVAEASATKRCASLLLTRAQPP